MEQRRRDAGVLQVTERDSIVLAWIAEQYVISFDHLQRLLAYHTPATSKNPEVLSVSATRNAVERWLQLGFIDQPQKVIREHPTAIWLSRRGLGQLGLAYPYYQPKASSVRHFYAVNAVRLHVQRYGLASLWTSQRALGRESAERPLPDAELRRGSAHIALQVIERSLMADITLREELEALRVLAARKVAGQGRTETQRYGQIWYFLHAQALPVFQQELALFDQAMRDRVRCYGLGAKALLTNPTQEG